MPVVRLLSEMVMLSSLLRVSAYAGGVVVVASTTSTTATAIAAIAVAMRSRHAQPRAPRSVWLVGRGQLAAGGLLEFRAEAQQAGRDRIGHDSSLVTVRARRRSARETRRRAAVGRMSSFSATWS